MSEVNIEGVESELPTWRISGTTATYGTSTNAQITIKGIKSLDGISLSASTVTIANSSLNQTGVTISNGYALALGSDVANPIYNDEDWFMSGDTAIYTGESNTAGYVLANNQIRYVEAKSGDSFTVSGVKSTDGLTIAGNVVTVSNSALKQSTVTINDNDYTLALGNDVKKTSTTAADWSISDNSAVYKNTAISAGYSIVNNQIIYNDASGGETLITVEGVKSVAGLSVSGNTITVTEAALNQSDVTISDGYTLNLQGVTAPKYTKAYFDGLTYKSASNTAGYELKDNKITYAAAKVW